MLYYSIHCDRNISEESIFIVIGIYLKRLLHTVHVLEEYGQHQLLVYQIVCVHA